MTTEIKYLTKEEAIEAVTKDGNELKCCTPELQHDEDVVLAAIKENSFSFQYASNELKSNKTLILQALNEGAYHWGLIKYSNISLQSDVDVMDLAIEKSDDGWVFLYAKGEVALNKELAALALVKFGKAGWAQDGSEDPALWEYLNPTLKEFFPKDSFYEKAQAYLIQLEQEKQAELVSGGSTEEDKVVW